MDVAADRELRARARALREAAGVCERVTVAGVAAGQAVCWRAAPDAASDG